VVVSGGYIWSLDAAAIRQWSPGGFQISDSSDGCIEYSIADRRQHDLRVVLQWRNWRGAHLQSGAYSGANPERHEYAGSSTTNADANAYCDSNSTTAYSDIDAYNNTNSSANGDTYGNGYSYGNSNGYSYVYADTDTDGYSNRDIYTYAPTNGYSNGQSEYYAAPWISGRLQFRRRQWDCGARHIWKRN
jgi:hypothetical protein